MKIPNAIKVSALAMLVTAGLVLGTAGPANAGLVRLYGVNFSSASGLNVPVPAGAGSYDGLSYMTMLSNGKIYTDEYFGWPHNLLSVYAKTFSYGWCAHPAHLVVTVDGNPVLDTYVGSATSSVAYSGGGYSLRFEPGWHRIAIIFDNDSWVSGQCDVNLDVEAVERDSDTSSFGGHIR